MSTNDNDDYESIINCGCNMIILIIKILAGGWSVNFLLSLFNEKIPFFWAAIVALFIGELTIPAAIVIKILIRFGIV